MMLIGVERNIDFKNEEYDVLEREKQSIVIVGPYCTIRWQIGPAN